MFYPIRLINGAKITDGWGPQSVPIGTLPQRQICETAQYLETVYGWGPVSVLKHTIGMQAASSQDRRSGAGMASRASIRAYSAKPPAHGPSPGRQA